MRSLRGCINRLGQNLYPCNAFIFLMLGWPQEDYTAESAVPIDTNMQYYSEFVLGSQYFGPRS
jgi:hypothetical protein